MNRRKLDRFLGDEKGAVTIEFTVLMPVFIMMMLFFADASVVWLTQSEMYNAARDVSRRMATGEINTAEEARQYAATRVFLSQRTYTIDTEFGGDRTVEIAVPLGEAAIFGAWFRPIIGQHLYVSVTTRKEPF